MGRVTDAVQRNVWGALAATFVVGVVLGLVVFGWWLFPVQWIDTLPADLDPAWQSTYLLMAADSYALTADAEAARERVTALAGDRQTLAQVAEELQALARDQAARDANVAARLQALWTVLGVPPPAAVPGIPPPVTQDTVPLLSRALRVCGLVILVLVVLAGLLLLVYFLQSRSTPGAREEIRTHTDEDVAVAEGPSAVVIAPATVKAIPRVPPVVPIAAETALGPFVATYNLGDIDFDMSFGIESASGDFLGECGLGMAETIGGGDVQRVTAFEIWLFDKTDIRTVSVVLASAHAHADAALRTKLASRGEIVLAQPGGAFSVKTSSLRLDGRVLDLAYGSGDVPAQSYFTTFSVELVPVPLLTGQR